VCFYCRIDRFFTLSEQFQNPSEKSVERGKIDTPKAKQKKILASQANFQNF
jgi:hypothetical protein